MVKYFVNINQIVKSQIKSLSSFRKLIRKISSEKIPYRKQNLLEKDKISLGLNNSLDHGKFLVNSDF